MRSGTARAALGVVGALTAIAVHGASEPAAAQADGDVLQLTLQEALRIAQVTNPTYRQALNTSGLNETEWRTTWFDQVLPTASLDLFATDFYGNIQRRARDNFGNPIENPSAEWVYFSRTTQALRLSWQIQGSSIFNALDGQRLTNQGRVFARTRALGELEVAVQREFWDVLEQHELRRAEEELLAAREVDLEVSERLFGLAMRTRVDVLRAELAVEQQRLALRQQEAEVERSKLALRTRLGDDDLPAFEPADTPLPLYDPAGLDGEALIRRAVDVNPGLAEARVAVASARVGLRDSNRAWWPTLFFDYNVARRAQTERSRALFDVSFNEGLDQQFFIGLSMPMFNSYFQNRQAIARAAVQLENESEAERDARLRIEEAVRGALLELENQWETLRVSERAGLIAGEALELAREEYRLGTRAFEALRQSIDDEADTRRQLIQARHAFADALLDLEEAVGARVRD